MEQAILILSLQLNSTKLFLESCPDVPITKNLLQTRIATLTQSLNEIIKLNQS